MYQSFSEKKEKSKKRQYAVVQYRNFSGIEK